jgi:transposase-like protein
MPATWPGARHCSGESDETFIGGEAKNMHKWKREKKIRGRGSVGKRIVQGLLERGGIVRAQVVDSTEAASLQAVIRSNVVPGATVYTDAHGSYRGLESAYVHQFVDHTLEYVRDRVHTNGLENFWSLFKRMLKGTYVHCAPFHLQRYVDEESTRYNDRGFDDSERFQIVMGRTSGRRVTWRQLCQVDGCGFMGLE